MGPKRKSSSPYASTCRKKKGSKKETPIPLAMVADQENEEDTSICQNNIGSKDTSTENCMDRHVITGTSTNTDMLNLDNPSLVTSVSDTLDAKVPHNLKEKIWNGEYIHLEKLLPNESLIGENEHQIVMVDGQFVVKPKHADKKILNIETWTNAFLVYASVFITKHPQEAKSLLKYIDTIRLGASRQSTLGWKSYDQQFRLRKSIDPLKKWEIVDTELWLLYMYQAPNTPIPAIKTNIGNDYYHSSSIGKCYDYNYKGNCVRNGCTYVHSCLKCNQAHPSVWCINSSRGQALAHQFRLPSNTSNKIRAQFPTPRRPFSGQFQQQRHMGVRKIPY